MKIKIKDHAAERHVTTLPEGAEVVGIISRGGTGGTGALVLLDTWEFVQINGGEQIELDQKHVYTAIIKAILSDFCEGQVDLAIEAGFSLATIQSWSSGRRVPNFGTIKLLLLTYNVIKR